MISPRGEDSELFIYLLCQSGLIGHIWGEGGGFFGSNARTYIYIYIYNTESEWCGIKEEAALWPFRPRPLVGGTVAPRSWHFAGDNIWPRKSGRKEAAVVGQGSVRLSPPLSSLVSRGKNGRITLDDHDSTAIRL